MEVKFENNKSVNLSIEEGQTTQINEIKEQTMIYKTLHRKLKIDLHELHKNWADLRCFDVKTVIFFDTSNCKNWSTRKSMNVIVNAITGINDMNHDILQR